MTDKTLDETLVEITRTLKALQALREKRKTYEGVKVCGGYPCSAANPAAAKTCEACGHGGFWPATRDDIREHAAAKRASLDLTRKLSDLRAGR